MWKIIKLFDIIIKRELNNKYDLQTKNINNNYIIYNMNLYIIKLKNNIKKIELYSQKLKYYSSTFYYYNKY